MAEITVIQPTEQPRRKLRCGAYCRVSTGREEQLHSFEAQQLWFMTLLDGSQTAELVDIYADMYNQRLIQCSAHGSVEKCLKQRLSADLDGLLEAFFFVCIVFLK